jgi:hypothetical protein
VGKNSPVQKTLKPGRNDTGNKHGLNSFISMTYAAQKNISAKTKIGMDFAI